VADPWTDDLAALGDRTRHQLRSLAATRASVLPKLTKESKMRLFKHHPVFATLITLVLLAVAAPLAYAVVDQVFISVDPDKSAGEIEHDVKSQLEHANVQAEVRAEKSPAGDRLQIRIDTTDERVGSNLAVDVAGGGPATQLGIRLAATVELTEAQQDQLQAAASSPAIIALLAERATGQGQRSDADFIAAIETALAAAGFHDATVALAGDEVQVTVTAAPR
jgi:hypothetical protein